MVSIGESQKLPGSLSRKGYFQIGSHLLLLRKIKMFHSTLVFNAMYVRSSLFSGDADKRQIVCASIKLSTDYVRL